MQNQQNCDPNELHYSYNLHITLPQQLHQFENQQNQHNFHSSLAPYPSPTKDHLYTNDFEFLGADSLYTINRDSLQIMPEPCGFDSSNPDDSKQINNIELKPSQSSLIFFEDFEDFQNENDEVKQRKLVIETNNLTIKSQTEIKEDIFSNYLPKKHRGLIKNINRKVHQIKHVKTLIRELKRQYKYNKEIIGDLMLKGQNFIKKIKHGQILPISNDKGHLSGLMIEHDKQQFKIRVVNSSSTGYQPRLELWSQQQQNWLQFQFMVKLHSH